MLDYTGSLPVSFSVRIIYRIALYRVQAEQTERTGNSAHFSSAHFVHSACTCLWTQIYRPMFAS